MIIKKIQNIEDSVLIIAHYHYIRDENLDILCGTKDLNEKLKECSKKYINTLAEKLEAEIVDLTMEKKILKISD